MICIDCDTEITGKPVCRATRSAVRCRVPVSSEGIGVVGHQVHGGPVDPGDVAVEDDRAVHLGQLAQAGGGERDVEGEAAGGDRLDGLVVAEHDQGAGAAAQDPLEPVAQGGAGRDATPASRAGAASRPSGRWPPRRSLRLAAASVGRAVSLGEARSGARVRRPRSASGAQSGSRASEPRSSSRSADAMSGTSTTRMPSTVARATGRRSPARSAGHDRAPEARAGPPRRAAAAGRAPGAARRPGRSRRSPPRRAAAAVRWSAEASAIATARSLAGSVSRAPPTVEAKTSWVCSRMPAVLLEHGEDHRDPRAVEPGRRTPRALGRRSA